MSDVAAEVRTTNNVAAAADLVARPEGGNDDVGIADELDWRSGVDGGQHADGVAGRLAR